MRCPVCGHNDWVKKVKKEPIVPISTAKREVVVYVCTHCGYEKKVD